MNTRKTATPSFCLFTYYSSRRRMQICVIRRVYALTDLRDVDVGRARRRVTWTTSREREVSASWKKGERWRRERFYPEENNRTPTAAQSESERRECHAQWQHGTHTSFSASRRCCGVALCCAVLRCTAPRAVRCCCRVALCCARAVAAWRCAALRGAVAAWRCAALCCAVRRRALCGAVSAWRCAARALFGAARAQHDTARYRGARRGAARSCAIVCRAADVDIHC